MHDQDPPSWLARSAVLAPFVLTAIAFVLFLYRPTEAICDPKLLLLASNLLLPCRYFLPDRNPMTAEALAIGALGFWLSIILCGLSALRPWPVAQALIKRDPSYFKIFYLGIIMLGMYYLIFATNISFPMPGSSVRNLNLFLVFAVGLPTVAGNLFGIGVVYLILYFSPDRSGKLPN